MAFGVLGLSPGEFDVLTPKEFSKFIKGFHWKRELDQKTTASHLLAIINTCGNLKKGTSVKMNKLYRSSNQDPDNPYYRNLIGK